jgi:uncharacterized protein
VDSELVIRRSIDLDLPRGKSAFLWGPRKCGKSTLLRSLFPGSIVLDLLQSDLYLALMKRPALLRERLLAEPAARLKKPVVLDEVQKIPALLDEVHWLIEERRIGFVLCGSSARKLVRGGANLLGGRAWRYHLFPLTSQELLRAPPGFDLLRALNQGLIPLHYLEDFGDRELDAYVHDYLKEEILAEGLTRNVPAFSRFLEVAAFSNGEVVNYSNAARDVGVDSKTIREYFQILQDTLLGYSLPPYTRTRRRDVLSRAPKFYFFDVGVAGRLARRVIRQPRGPEFGRAFEHFILMELVAHRAYARRDHEIRFFRTKAGQEVDFVLGEGEVAIEVKGSSRVDGDELRSLRSFTEENRPRQALLVSNEPAARKVGPILVLPWRIFLERLWAGEIL